MKDRAIEIATKDKGFPKDAAEAQWQKVEADCGAPPTAAMLESYDMPAYLAIGVTRSLADAWAGAFGRKAHAPDGSTKGKKFKEEKARAYLHAEITTFVAVDPKGEMEGLRAEVKRRTGGQPFRFIVDGKLREAETTERIRALYERDPVAPFVVIDGKEVEPVGFDETAAKEDDEDPFEEGVALGQPGHYSTRLGVSLAKVGKETQKAIRVVVKHDLRGASIHELQKLAAAAEGKTPDEVLAHFALARREWPKLSPKPTLMVPRPFADPSAQTPTAGAGGFEPYRTSSALQRLTPTELANAQGLPAPRGGRGPLGRTLRRLFHEELVAAHAIIVASGKASSRDGLLSGIHPNIVAGLPTHAAPAEQVYSDLFYLVAVNMTDGSCPERTYIQNAVRLLTGRQEAGKLTALLAGATTTAPPQTASTAPIVYVVGAQIEAAAGNQIRSLFSQEEREGAVRVVLDSDMSPGTVIQKWRDQRMAEATVIVGLISADTLVANVVPDDPRVIPVIVRPIVRLPTYLRNRACIPASGKPVDNWAAAVGELAGVLGIV